MQEGFLKINYEEMLEKDNMGLEEIDERFFWKEEAKVIITVIGHEMLLYIH